MRSRGFTILELLVIIAIIAILASAILVSLNGTQEKARDTRRMEDMSSLQKALQLYMIGNGHYPVETSTTTLTGSDPVMSALIASGAIAQTPTDPSSPVSDYSYISNQMGNEYWLGFCLETDTIANHTKGCGNTVTP
jgi:general secretion pathway protein G